MSLPEPWKLTRGALPLPGGSARFSVWAPRVEQLSVVVFGDDGPRAHALEQGADGVFAGTVARVAAGTDYAYRLDGSRDRPDPVSRFQPRGVHGPSRVVSPDDFAWSDAGWTGVTMPDLVVYELHVGTFTTAGSFDAVAERLPVLRELGVTAVELMPVAEFPGRRNWGYDGVHPYAPHAGYGGPDGLKRLVDAAHRAGLAVILDVVYNHLGPEGNYLGEFGPYFTERYRTPWGAAVNFDDADCDEVRRYFVDNALYWVTEFHIDGLRLDAVHAIYDFGARHVLEEIGAAVHAEAGRRGRHAVVIAESDLNDPRLVRPRELGGYALDGQWSDDFHHAVHAALTGERGGYYADFGSVEAVAGALRKAFVYAGQYSKFRRRRHGAPATGVPASCFVVAIQNHDQIGNRAVGDRFGTLLAVERQRLAAALLLLSPYVPMLFMGEEHGEIRPFLYFVSHGDPELAEAVRRGRREEFASFQWSGELPDPEAEESFLRSRIDWAAREHSPHKEILRLYRSLLALRRAEPALRPDAAEVHVMAHPISAGASEGWIAVRYDGERGRELLALFNLSAEKQTAGTPPVPPGGWRLLLSTADEAYGGPGKTACATAVPELEPFEGAIYESASPAEPSRGRVGERQT